VKQLFDRRQQTLLHDLCEKYAAVTTDEVLQQGARYLEKLLYYNSSVPLISRAGDSAAHAAQLFMTSLAALEYLPPDNDFVAIDLGSGGGFPAVPLKIARPASQWVLIESRGRKCTALEAIISHLGIAGMTVIHGRFEKIPLAAESKIQVVTSRAGPSPVEVVKWAKRFPALKRVLVFESSADQDLCLYYDLESDFYSLKKKEFTSTFDVESLWLLSFEKRR
jgi:16S rRNA (guanine527-N7)-methyltransferase